MKKMNHAFAMLAMAAAFQGGLGSPSGPHIREKKTLSDEEIKEREEKSMEAKGLKKFEFPNGYVWAINRKNAEKKALKKGFIHPFETI